MIQPNPEQAYIVLVAWWMSDWEQIRKTGIDSLAAGLIRNFDDPDRVLMELTTWGYITPQQRNELSRRFEENIGNMAEEAYRLWGRKL